ncbi:MAG TPA: hypothetical protein DDZ19_00445 [Flavobacteriales bacterium]|jgi:protein TonB|nr:hypothetical protein [Flavobacteriales bacterium]
MKKQPAFRRHFELGLIASMAFVLAAFEWTAVEYGSSDGWNYTPYQSLEAELVPVHVPSKPPPPNRPLNVAPEIHPDPPRPAPLPDPAPDVDPLLGKIQSFDFGNFGEGEDWEEIETVLVAEHMPHFYDCTNVLDRDAERTCTEQQLIALIQSCAKFPPLLRESGIGGVVYLQFNINEFGHITDEKILKEAHPKLNKAALEALQCIPPLVPGTQLGKPVRVTYTMPVRFTVR